MSEQKAVEYDEAEVLMITWESAHDHARMEHERARLACVFGDKLNYNITCETLFLREQLYWRRRLDQIMDDWMRTRDDLDTLFIIYIAGHGHMFRDEIVGGMMTKQAKELERIANAANICEYIETKIEHLVSHVFGIWDFSYTDFAAPYPSRIRTVEYITPASKYERTGYPGRASFTTVLTDAFEKLIETEEGFTSSQLFDMIKITGSVYAQQTRLAQSDLQQVLRKQIAFRRLGSSTEQFPRLSTYNLRSLTPEDSMTSDYTWAEELEQEAEKAVDVSHPELS